MMGIGTPLVLIFWMPLKLYDPLIFGSVSPTLDLDTVGFWGVSKPVTPSMSKLVPTVFNKPPILLWTLIKHLHPLGSTTCGAYSFS